MSARPTGTSTPSRYAPLFSPAGLLAIGAAVAALAAAAASLPVPPMLRAALAALAVLVIALGGYAIRQREHRLLAKAAEIATRFARGERALRLAESTGSTAFAEFARVLNRAANALAAREAQFALLARATGDAVWDWDLDTNVVACVHGGSSGLGAPADTFAEPFSWWQERVHPEDRQAVEDSVAAIRASAKDGDLWSVEYRFLHADGGYRWVWDRGVVVSDAAGRPVRILGCMTDISDRKAAEEQLQHVERRQRSLITAVSSIVWREDLGSSVQPRNLAWEDYTGQTQEEEFGEGWLAAVHPEDREGMLRAWSEAVKAGSVYQHDIRIRRRDGTYRWMSARGAPVRDHAGKVVEFIGLYEDIQEHYEAREELRRKTLALGKRVKEMRCLHAITVVCNHDELRVGDILKGVALVLPSALAEPDAGVCSIEWNDTVRRSPAYIDPATALRAPLEVDGGEIGSITLGYSGTRDLHAFVPEEEQLLKSAANMVAQMLARRRDRERLEKLANHDALTSLPNRRWFQEKLESAVSDGEGPCALILLDLDHFKDVNDTLGHDIGDALLRAVADRLRGTAGKTATVARLGGDEFAVLAPVSDRSEAERLGERLMTAIGRPLTLAGRSNMVRFSAGLAVSPADGRSAAELLKNADIALYWGKMRGRSAFVPFEPQMRSTMERRITVCAEVRDALDRGEFVPFYQPKIALESGAIAGFEALLRWNHPEGLRGPAAVMPAFEDHALALALCRRMLDRIMADMSEWRQQRLAFGHVAFNASAAEFSGFDLAEHLLGRLSAAGLPPSLLGVEVTETVLLGSESESVGPALRRLHAAGVTIALDDFGTGYASLTHLQQYPVDIIKIDRSFIRGIDSDSGSRAITSAILGLGGALGMTVIAEGVETADQAELLRLAGCGQAQGYFFARPMPAADVPAFVPTWKGRASIAAPPGKRSAA